MRRLLLRSLYVLLSLMRRLDPEALAIHIEIALSTAPARTLESFRSAECYHPRATADLARYVANRLAGLEFTTGTDWVDPEAQRSLFNGKC